MSRKFKAVFTATTTYEVEFTVWAGQLPKEVFFEMAEGDIISYSQLSPNCPEIIDLVAMEEIE